MNELGESRSRRAAEQVCERRLGRMTAGERVDWALRTLPGEHIVSSSFGAQSAVMLHLMASRKADIPIVVVDTGYLFPETYRFIDELTERLDLNLHVFRPRVSGAWQEARHGRRWEDGVAGIEQYNRENKVEPMERALRQLDVGTWFAGLRRTQSATRSGTPLIESSSGRWKVYPIADWSDRDGLRIPVSPQAALPPALGEGLRIDRRRSHDAVIGGCGLARGNALLWPQARVWPARDGFREDGLKGRENSLAADSLHLCQR